jgi:hypothetical protein
MFKKKKLSEQLLKMAQDAIDEHGGPDVEKLKKELEDATKDPSEQSTDFGDGDEKKGGFVV